MVFTDKTIGEFINSRFISLRVNTSRPEGKEPRARYKVRGFPTVLFLTPRGEEIDRICGFDGVKEPYFRILQEIAGGENTLRTLLTRLKAEPGNADVQFKLGKKYLARWEGELAMPHFREVLRLDPSNRLGLQSECTGRQAIYQAEEKRNIQPLVAFIATNPANELLAEAYASLARYHVRAKNRPESMSTFTEALQKLPGHAGLMRSYQKAIFELQVEDRYDEGIELARQLTVMEKDSLDSWLELGYAYQGKKDYRQAGEVFSKCRALFPDRTAVLYQQGKNVLLSGENLPAGLAVFEEFLKLPPQADAPGHDAARWRMGMIYEKMGDSGRAITMYEEALKINPDYSEVKEALEKLRKK